MEEKEIVKEEKDGLCKKGLLGFLIGLAVIVPGISGSTIAIIFKLYKKLLHAIANFIKEFKLSIIFLAPIIIGMILGIVVGFFTIQKLIDLIPFAIVCLFSGLMLGATPSLRDEVKDVKIEKKQIILIIIGALIPILMSTISIIFTETTDIPESKLTIDFPSICIYVVLGFLVAATQFIPGCSATVVLMSLGYFIPLMNSFKFSYISANPSVFLVYLCLGVGFIIGCAVVSKSFNMLIEKYKGLMYFVFIGLSLGSIVSLFVNADMINVYQDWAVSGKFPFLEVFLGIGLFVGGLLIAYELVKYMRRKGNNEINEIKESE